MDIDMDIDMEISSGFGPLQNLCLVAMADT